MKIKELMQLKLNLFSKFANDNKVKATEVILKVILSDIDDIDSKLKKTSFQVQENSLKVINNLDDYLTKDSVDNINYKILVWFRWK